jgi:hypothetical protein
MSFFFAPYYRHLMFEHPTLKAVGQDDLVPTRPQPSSSPLNDAMS